MKDSKVSKYIADARSGKVGSRYHNFVNEPGQNRAFVRQPGLYNQTGPGNPVKKSRPYIVWVSSASGADVTDFDILGANEYINNAGMTAAGSLVIGSITIYSGIPNVSYRDFLYQSQQNPFTVGQTYIYSSNTSQIQEVFTVKTKDATGVQVTIPITPTVDPYQQQTTSVVNEDEYSIDGNTKLTISTVLANAVIKFQFYQTTKVNPGNLLDGQGQTSQYANPGVIR